MWLPGPLDSTKMLAELATEIEALDREDVGAAAVAELLNRHRGDALDHRPGERLSPS